jgi:site-specific DNA-methyltransferase (adenine-specific)
MSAPPKRATENNVALAGLGTVVRRNDRPRPDVPAPDYVPSLDQLVTDARAAEKLITDLDLTQKRTAKVLLFENLDQAKRIDAAVELGQSVAAFARQAGITERRAQRLYKLASRSDGIKKEVEAAEAQYGDDYQCPSWKQFLRPEPAEQEDGTGLAKKLIVDALHEELGAARTRIIELESASKLADTAREELEARLQAPNGRGAYGKSGRGNQEHEVPQWFFDHLDREFHLTLDVASNKTNKKCDLSFTTAENGLLQIWHGNVWLNPPYSKIEPWCKKGWEYAQTGKGVVVALLPLWTTASWFRKYAIHGHIRLLTTRFGAVGTKGPAPFHSMVVVWTATSQFREGRLHVTIEELPVPTKAARKATVATETR